MIGSFPLLAIAIAAYNLLAFLGGKTGADLPGRLVQPSTSVNLASGAAWSPTMADLIVALAIGALVVDLVRMFAAAKTEAGVHIWAGLALFVCSLEFMMVPSFATSAFALITFMAVLSLLASLVMRLFPRGGAARQFRSGQ